MLERAGRLLLFWGGWKFCLIVSHLPPAQNRAVFDLALPEIVTCSSACPPGFYCVIGVDGQDGVASDEIVDRDIVWGEC